MRRPVFWHRAIFGALVLFWIVVALAVSAILSLPAAEIPAPTNTPEAAP